MAHTNKTPNYNLPQFVNTDKPAWLTDVNSAMVTIDTEIKLNADNATNAKTTSAQAKLESETALNKATAVETTVNTIKDTLGTANGGIVKDVADLKTVVGDSESGLVHKVSGLESGATTTASEIASLKSAVGDSNSGLVKSVADNATEIAGIKATVGDTNSGLVKKVADLYAENTTIKTNVSSNATNISALDTRVTTLENSGGGGGGGTFNILLCYPVGSYYETSDTSFNPNTAWGGSWVEDSAGKVTVGADGTTYIAGQNGGNKEVSHTHTTQNHTLLTSEIPDHVHTAYSGAGYTYIETDDPGNVHSGAQGKNVSSLPSGDAHLVFTYSTNVIHSGNSRTTGGVDGSTDRAHNHGETTATSVNVMQPYTVVKRWHRIA